MLPSRIRFAPVGTALSTHVLVERSTIVGSRPELGYSPMGEEAGDGVGVEHALGCELDARAFAPKEPCVFERREMGGKVGIEIRPEELLVLGAIDREARQVPRE